MKEFSDIEANRLLAWVEYEHPAGAKAIKWWNRCDKFCKTLENGTPTKHKIAYRIMDAIGDHHVKKEFKYKDKIANMPYSEWPDKYRRLR